MAEFKRARKKMFSSSTDEEEEEEEGEVRDLTKNKNSCFFYVRILGGRGH